MTQTANAPLVRDLRGGRRIEYRDLPTLAANLAAQIRGIMLKNPSLCDDDELDLEGLWASLNRLATRGVALPPTDPMRLLTARQLGQELHGLSEDMVWIREKDGALFSVLPAGRRRGRLYPAFQALEGIVGEPLAGVLATLDGLDGELQLTFFRLPRADLEGLTPVEVMLGHALDQRELTQTATTLAMSHPRARHAEVLTAAQHFRCEWAMGEKAMTAPADEGHLV